jgi:hypothetical protein
MAAPLMHDSGLRLCQEHVECSKHNIRWPGRPPVGHDPVPGSGILTSKEFMQLKVLYACSDCLCFTCDQDAWIASRTVDWRNLHSSATSADLALHARPGAGMQRPRPP